ADAAVSEAAAVSVQPSPSPAAVEMATVVESEVEPEAETQSIAEPEAAIRSAAVPEAAIEPEMNVGDMDQPTPVSGSAGLIQLAVSEEVKPEPKADKPVAVDARESSATDTPVGDALSVMDDEVSAEVAQESADGEPLQRMINEVVDELEDVTADLQQLTEEALFEAKEAPLPPEPQPIAVKQPLESEWEEIPTRNEDDDEVTTVTPEKIVLSEERAAPAPSVVERAGADHGDEDDEVDDPHFTKVLDEIHATRPAHVVTRQMDRAPKEHLPVKRETRDVELETLGSGLGRIIKKSFLGMASSGYYLALGVRYGIQDIKRLLNR
ncbi:MAG: hypothetical protein HQL48_11780, partial [Gammaproteobacteria bacterium]|nr:hypothetical protein [Gammaproteobacteria bacterium]